MTLITTPPPARGHLGRGAASVVLLLAPLMLAACGDDDAASDEYEEFCAAELAVERATMGEDMAAMEAAMADLVEAAPDDDSRDKVQATIDAFMALDGPPDDAFNATYGELIQVVKDECGYEELEVAAADYSFSGVGDDLPGGPTVITFENTGGEFHEMIIIKRGDGVDAPVEELLMMDQDEVADLVADVGGAFAAPGATGYTVVDLEPGRYIVACFIPKGATQDAWDAMMAGGPEPDGDPHAMHGMIAEFEVEA